MPSSTDVIFTIVYNLSCFDENFGNCHGRIFSTKIIKCLKIICAVINLKFFLNFCRYFQGTCSKCQIQIMNVCNQWLQHLAVYWQKQSRYFDLIIHEMWRISGLENWFNCFWLSVLCWMSSFFLRISLRFSSCLKAFVAKEFCCFTAKNV